MPTRHQNKFVEKKCPTTYAAQLRTPTCNLARRPFTPRPKTTIPTPDPKPPMPVATYATLSKAT